PPPSSDPSAPTITSPAPPPAPPTTSATPPNVTAIGGGTVTSADGKATLVFAPGAVQSDVNVVIGASSTVVPSSVSAASTVYELSATGAASGAAVDHFVAAPQLTVSYDPAANGLPGIYFVDSTGAAQRLSSDVDRANHTVSAFLPHFRAY